MKVKWLWVPVVVAALQYLLLHATKGLSMYTHQARQLGVQDRDVDVLVVEALFSTVTNVDFDAQRLQAPLVRAVQLRDKAREKAVNKRCGATSTDMSG